MGSRFEAAAAELCGTRIRRGALGRLSLELEPRNEGEAYAIQDALHPCLSAGGWGAVVGYKIGCTTRVMQDYLRIPNPCAGGIFAASVQREHGRFRHADFIRVGVECEVAVLLAQDLGSSAEPIGRDGDHPSGRAGRNLVDRAAAARAVGACMAAIEIVDDRYVDYSSLGAPTLIADDFFGAGCVLGPPVPGFDPAQLAAVRASMRIDNREVGSGQGTDILGEPLEALVWLANTLARRGQRLRAGEFVLLGSLVQTQWVAAGQSVVIENDRLGVARADFA